MFAYICFDPTFLLKFFFLLRFEINFQSGFKSQHSDDIALKINPQIVRLLVLSSVGNESRQTKVSASDKEAAFNMFVVIKSEAYEVGDLNLYVDK